MAGSPPGLSPLSQEGEEPDKPGRGNDKGAEKGRDWNTICHLHEEPWPGAVWTLRWPREEHDER